MTTAAILGQTTGVIAPAADDVSIAVSGLFGAYSRDFQAITSHAAALLHEFTSLFDSGTADNVRTDMTSTAGINPPPPAGGAAAGETAAQKHLSEHDAANGNISGVENASRR